MSEVSFVAEVNLISSGSLQGLYERFPSFLGYIEASSLDDWHLYFAVACTGIVLKTTEQFEGEHDHVLRGTSDDDYERLLRNFSDFVDKWDGDEPSTVAVIGLWVLWNMKKQKPEADDLVGLAPAIGHLVLYAVQEWRAVKAKD